MQERVSLSADLEIYFHLFYINAALCIKSMNLLPSGQDYEEIVKLQRDNKSQALPGLWRFREA